MENVFVYGTLGEKEFQLKLFGREIPIHSEAALHDWRKKTDREYPYLVPKEHSVTHGKVIQLTQNELAIADAWEEVPESYIRIKADVVTSEGHVLSCWVYVAPTR